jgi:hypothetical protein
MSDSYTTKQCESSIRYPAAISALFPEHNFGTKQPNPVKEDP